MDQDSFRQLLATSKAVSSSRPSILPPRAGATSTTNASSGEKTSFKPRKVNANKKFRDRAAERREGINDYAEVEAILEDFNQRHAKEDPDTVDEKRKYLGGDSDHSILVKGLDYALLERNKAREAALRDEEADAALEDAFASTSTPTIIPKASTQEAPTDKKRTREQLIAELKRKRESGVAVTEKQDNKDTLEPAKKMGKFRPIGAPRPDEKGVEPEKRKKKKRKIIPKDQEGQSVPSPLPESGPPISKRSEPEKSSNPSETPSTSRLDFTGEDLAAPPIPSSSSVQPLPSKPPKVDFDIFADAGDYEGINFDDEEDEVLRQDDGHPISSTTQAIPRWFDDDEQLSDLSKPVSGKPLPDHKLLAGRTSSEPDPPRSSRRSPARSLEEGEDAEGSGASQIPVRLQPLSSSYVPSVKELLEMDKAEEAREKKKARKQKYKAANGGSGGGTGEPAEPKAKPKLGAEQKLNRDFQQYNAYVEKLEKKG